MALIRQLPPGVVNKIAAGEVVERPASVVKELMENAIDAGAARVDVTVEQGGTQLVRIADNGHGIEPEQLPLAVASHATSKIQDADDLFQVATLGFRGEALASIAAVSQFRLRSRVSESAAGAELEVNGGEMKAVEPCGCPVGTTLEVRNLFFNTPVRRKFLRSTQTEMGHVTEAFTRLALAHPAVHFTLTHNERPVFTLPAASDWRERIATFFGDDVAQALIAVESADGDLRLAGYVANPAHSRNHNRMQYLFLNGRCIRDRALQHALGEAYRGLLMVGRYPICFMRLDMPADAVDVNVHPTKLEVRFQDSGRVYSQLLGSIRKRFLATDLTAKVQPVEGGAAAENEVALVARGDAEKMRQELVDWAKGQLATANPARAESLVTEPSAQPVFDLRFDSSHGGGLTLNRINREAILGKGADEVASGELRAKPNTENAVEESRSPVARQTSTAAPAIQVHNKYLIAETNEGIEVIDQHALHERILYEELREKVAQGKVESQRLLVPEPVDLTPQEAAAVLEAKEELGQLGIEIESLGGGTLLVSAYPAMLANIGPGEVLRYILEPLLATARQVDKRDLFDRLLHGIACKAAIKAGDRLTGAEIVALLEQRHLAQDTHHCPHGRPTTLIFTREELDRRFGRI